MKQRFVFATLVFCALLFGKSGESLAQSEYDCGDPFSNGVGPWDYRDQDAQRDPRKIPIVERYHFDPKVEQLKEGQTQADLAGDLDYVLRAVPNHYRALYAISRYEHQQGKVSPVSRSAECYFKRAQLFRPDDAVVGMIFGIHWAMRDEHEKALAEYETIVSELSNSAELHYNMGLSYLELEDYESAVASAAQAYQNGYPLPGLREKLANLGFELPSN